uniref:VWFA domain-containing protein n=1 Tax=Bursaphelenchus xylophilus TaxID=6326 RepID=A0A1I7SDU2_BURXY
MRNKHHYVFLVVLASFYVVSSQQCERTPVKVLVVFDITLGDGKVFSSKKGITEEVLRHIDAVGKGREINYGFIAYHSHAVVLSSLKSNKSKSLDVIISHINGIRPRPGFKSSVGNSINAAVDHIAQQTNIGGHNIIILVSNGDESEEVDNLVMAVKRLWSLNIELFAITDPSSLYLSTLLAKNRKNVFSAPSDFPHLLKAIDSSIKTCLEDVQPNGLQRIPYFETSAPLRSKLLPESYGAHCGPELKVTFLNILGNAKDKVSTFFTDFLGNRGVNIVTVSSASESIAHIIQDEVDHLKEWKGQKILIIFNQKTTRSSWGEILETYHALEANNILTIIGNPYRSLENEMKIYAGKKGFVIFETEKFLSTVVGYTEKCAKNKNSAGSKNGNDNRFTKQATSTTTVTAIPKATAELSTSTLVTNRETTTITQALEVQGSTISSAVSSTEEDLGFDDIQECNHETDILVLLDPNINSIAEFEKRRNILLELTISLPKRFKLAISNLDKGFTNGKELLLSYISGLKLEEVKNSDPITLLGQLPDSSSVIYIDGSDQSLLTSGFNRFADFAVITSKKRVQLFQEKYKTFQFDLIDASGPRFYTWAFRCMVALKKPENVEVKRQIKSADNSNNITPDSHNSSPAEIELFIDSNNDTECRTDVIFVLDTSQSVEARFQDQLQVIADFIASAPQSDFESRVKVGLVTFNNEAKTILDLSQFRTKEVIVNTVLSIEHTGGPTSLVKGVEEVLNLIKLTQDLARRLTIVLVSDGNSQDEWSKVLSTSNSLRQIKGEVFTVAVSNDYFLRELELYAGNKDRVYVEGRLPQFLSALKGSSIICESKKENIIPQNIASKCNGDPIDLVFIVDTASTDFLSLKNSIKELINSIEGVGSRIRIALSKADRETGLVLGFREGITNSDVTFEIEKLSPSLQTSLVSAVNLAVNELLRSKRGARKIVIVVSNGSSIDQESEVTTTSMRLKDISDKIYVYNPDGKVDLLKSYINQPEGLVTSINRVKTELQKDLQCKESVKAKPSEDTSPELESKDIVIPLTEKPIFEHNECAKNKMDLIVILDASTSRENVFEHQRELALSLIERLPISKFDTHVATGINSFNEEATLGQTLSFGRDRDMVRQSIEQINYVGGSTYTSKAVNLAIDDLERNGRKDATKVIVLMNDGMSQDPWELVVQTSKRLAESGAVRFGVALGQEVDLRELQLYAGGLDRIYRDGSTEKFLHDVVSLLNKTNCGLQQDPSSITELSENELLTNTQSCQRDIDIVIFLDNSGGRLNTTRYLALDIIGSLPMNDHVKVSLVSFAGKPIIVHGLKDDNSKNNLFKIVDQLRTGVGDPNYVAALERGLEYFKANRRPDVPGLFLIIGDGNATNQEAELQSLQIRLKASPDLSVISVSNEEHVNTKKLEYLTGSEDRIFSFKQNSNFTTELMKITKGLNCDKAKSTLLSDTLEGSGLEEQELQQDAALLTEDPFGDSKIYDKKGKPDITGLQVLKQPIKPKFEDPMTKHAVTEKKKIKIHGDNHEKDKTFADSLNRDRYMASKKSLEINPDHLIMKDLCERVKVGEIPCDLDVLIFETDSVLFRRRARHLLQQNSRMIKHGLDLDEADAVSPHPPQWRLI